MVNQRIILLGAARSGTKIFRDVLACATGAGSVPYDIGFVWRYQNESADDDALDPATASPKVSEFIRKYVRRYESPETAAVIEKTVGNTLRVPFVNAVFPEASFVHLIRDGVDVVESARRQWLAPPEVGYLVQKLRHFPPRLLPTYGRKYAISTLRRRVNGQSRAGTWGPRYPNIDADVIAEPLLTVCARQWRSSVVETRRGLGQIDAPVVEVRYEDLVAEPRATLESVLRGLKFDADEARLVQASGMLEPGRSGVGADALSSDELETLDHQIGATLQEFGYLPATDRARL